MEIEGRKSRTSEGRVEGLLGRRSYYPRFVTARIQVLAWSSSGVGVVACMGGVWYNPGLVNFHFGEGLFSLKVREDKMLAVTCLHLDHKLEPR